MATAIAVYRGDGTLVGRCDSRCHYATQPRCDCICRGRLHRKREGAFAENARLWTGSELQEAIADFAVEHGLDDADLRAKVANPTLFDSEETFNDEEV
jgi:hypothetical protein